MLRELSFILGAVLAMTDASLAATPVALKIEIAGTEEILFDHGRDACETWDIPDTPTRAYRAADGTLRVFQTTFRNRSLAGDSFGNLRHGCGVAFEGSDSTDPATFDHRSWIASTHSPDGRTVFGIVHDEFHGERFGASCTKDRNPLACWYNALTAVVSHDGGASFAPARPRRLVAALPFRADETENGHAGYFEPTNIVSQGGALFMMANVVSPAPQRSGNCLLRTTRIADPANWRAWHDGGFATAFADPYAEPVAKTAQLCDPVAPSVLRWPVTSLVRHAATGTWIATMKGRIKDGNGRERTGIFYATSRDLLAWDGPELLFEAPIAGNCGAASVVNYPALIDPESADRNFGTVSDRAMLTFVRMRQTDCNIGPDRDVAMRPVRIVPAGR